MSARRTVVVIVLAGLTVIGTGCSNPGSTRPGRSSAAQDEARRKQVQGQFSSWDGSHKGLTRYIKRSLDNPASFEHVKTTFDDRLVNLVVTTTYKSRNAAGQIVTSTITAKVDISGRILEIVSKR